MNARITSKERNAELSRLANAQRPVDHRARHIANAREWLRRYLQSPKPEGTEPEAIYSAFLSECKMANVAPLTVSPAA